MRGNYIVIEGLEGSGKTTASNTVFNILKEFGIKKIIFTREPGGTRLAEKIRSLLLEREELVENNEKIDDKTEVLMFYAARIQLVETIIKPALKEGIWVIGDRHDLSTQAYQGGGRLFNIKMLNKIRKIVLDNFSPELTLYLDLMPEIGLMRKRRAHKKLDYFEKESLAFFNRTRSFYLKKVEQNSTIFLIDATQSLENVKNQIRKKIINWFKTNNII